MYKPISFLSMSFQGICFQIQRLESKIFNLNLMMRKPSNSEHFTNFSPDSSKKVHFKGWGVLF